nr:ABC transporter ATP-binding protein [Belliella kenyensis]
MSIIKVEGVSKRYRLGLKEKQAKTLAGQLANVIKSPFENFKRLKSLSKFEGNEDESIFWALKDVSFEVQQGEVLGIIGKNGAGKSTLLKILSQITEPTSGRIEMRGRVASLLEVGTGFHPELSGRENIYMNGTILGMTKREIDSKLDEIIDFSGVEKFIDTPVKFYSSGMKVRLGFSVAAHLDPEILIIDEVLAVGDYEFQQKCLGKMEDVSKNQGRTVLFVSHNMGAVQELCDSGLMISDGKVIYKGNLNTVISSYLEFQKDVDNNYKGPNQSLKKYWIKEICYIDNSRKRVSEYFHNERVIINFVIGSNNKFQDSKYTLFCTILNEQGSRICSFESSQLSEFLYYELDAEFLVRGTYFLHVFLHEQGIEKIEELQNVCKLNIIDKGSKFLKHGNYNYGNVFSKGKWVDF